MESFSSGGGDPNALIHKMGIDYLEHAKTFEKNGKIDQAYKFYKEAANKFVYILRNAEYPLEPQR
jgi:hypothetical protein